MPTHARAIVNIVYVATFKIRTILHRHGQRQKSAKLLQSSGERKPKIVIGRRALQARAYDISCSCHAGVKDVM
jgi:hypothetical protein